MCKESMKRMSHKTAEAHRTINEMFPKKKTLTPACIFFNLLQDVSILVIFYLTIYMMYLIVVIKGTIKKYILKFKRIISEN